MQAWVLTLGLQPGTCLLAELSFEFLVPRLRVLELSGLRWQGFLVASLLHKDRQAASDAATCIMSIYVLMGRFLTLPQVQPA